jgi:hypothetical protein
MLALVTASPRSGPMRTGTAIVLSVLLVVIVLAAGVQLVLAR